MLKRMSDAYPCDLEVHLYIQHLLAHAYRQQQLGHTTQRLNLWTNNKHTKTKQKMHYIKVQQCHGCIAITNTKNINSINAIEFFVLLFAHFAPLFAAAQLKSMSSIFFFKKNLWRFLSVMVDHIYIHFALGIFFWDFVMFVVCASVKVIVCWNSLLYFQRITKQI